MPYVDGYVLPIPKKNVAAYRKMATAASRIWKKHGALEYRECIGDDLDIAMCLSFPKGIRSKKNETVCFAWVVYRSRAHRDAVNKKVMADPALHKWMTRKMPFDPSRMMMGGFKVIVEAFAKRR